MLHHTPIANVIERNMPGGANWVFLAQLCIVSTYQFWEDHYRHRIAEALTKRKNDIAIDAFNELRHLRRAIVHNRGKATAEVAQNKELPSFPEGEQIRLDSEAMQRVIQTLQRQVRRYAESNDPTAA